MNSETVQAIKESIAHWERMRDDPKCGEQPTVGFCALCEMFLDEARENCCSGCPVFEETGLLMCQGSPYPRASLAWYNLERWGEKYLPAWQQAAQAEIDFLKSLLPKEDQQG